MCKYNAIICFKLSRYRVRCTISGFIAWSPASKFVCVLAKVTHTAVRSLSGFLSLKRLGVFQSIPLRGEACLLQVSRWPIFFSRTNNQPLIAINLYSFWGILGHCESLTVCCTRAQHNVPGQGVNPEAVSSEFREINHAATGPLVNVCETNYIISSCL